MGRHWEVLKRVKSDFEKGKVTLDRIWGEDGVGIPQPRPRINTNHIDFLSPYDGTLCVHCPNARKDDFAFLSSLLLRLFRKVLILSSSLFGSDPE